MDRVANTADWVAGSVSIAEQPCYCGVGMYTQLECPPCYARWKMQSKHELNVKDSAATPEPELKLKPRPRQDALEKLLAEIDGLLEAEASTE